MYLKTKYNLWKIKKSLSPSVIFKASLQKDLNKVWDATYGKNSWFHSGIIYRAGAMAVAILVLVGSGGAYAYTSSDITEGSPLYPVKKAIEKVEEIAKISPEAKAKFYLKKIERREAERENLKKIEMVSEVKNYVNLKAESVNIESESSNAAEIKRNNQDSSIESKVKTNANFRIKIKNLKNNIERTDKSIEAAEDELEKFNERIKRNELKNVKLRTEVKVKIEKRLEQKNRRKTEKDSLMSSDDIAIRVNNLSKCYQKTCRRNGG